MTATAMERAEALDAVDRIAKSGVLGSGPRLSALLSFVVETELAGEGSRIKAYTIAIDVFGRPADFDPSTDSIVRVEFNRLRQALQHYYAVEGRDDPLRIDIPKGTYRPSFTLTGVEPETAPGATDAAPGKRADRGMLIGVIGAAALALVGLILVVVFLSPFGLSNGFAPVERHIRAVHLAMLPFSAGSDDAADKAVSERMSDATIRQLTGNSLIEVRIAAGQAYSSLPEALRSVPQDTDDTLVLAGILRPGLDGKNLFVGLMDPSDGLLVWSQDYDLNAPNDATALDDLAESIVSDLQPPLLGAVKHKLETMPTEALNAWELYLLASVGAGDELSNLAREKSRIALAERALALEPNLGEAHAALASRLSALVLADPDSDTVAFRDSVLMHARRAEQLAPQNASVAYELGVTFLRMGDRDHARTLFAKATTLDPGQVYSRIFNGAFDGICGTATQGMIDAISREDRKLAPTNPARWLTNGMLARLYLDFGEPEPALEAQQRANQFAVNPDMVFQHAAILAALDRVEEARAWLERWRADWPTLSVDHFVNVALPRMCGADADSLPVRAPFLELARKLGPGE